METLLTKREVAEILKVCERTIDNLLRSGVLVHIKLGRSVRFVKSDVEECIRRLRCGQSP